MNKHKDHMQNGFVNYLVIQFGINSIFFLLFLHFAYLNLYLILILFRQNIKIKSPISEASTIEKYILLSRDQGKTSRLNKQLCVQNFIDKNFNFFLCISRQ